MAGNDVVKGRQGPGVTNKRVEEAFRALVAVLGGCDVPISFDTPLIVPSREVISTKQTPQLGSDRLIRLKEVLAYIPVGKTTWWEGVRFGRYPQPVRHLGPRVTAWKLSSIMRLINGEVETNE